MFAFAWRSAIIVLIYNKTQPYPFIQTNVFVKNNSQWWTTKGNLPHLLFVSTDIQINCMLIDFITFNMPQLQLWHSGSGLKRAFLRLEVIPATLALILTSMIPHEAVKTYLLTIETIERSNHNSQKRIHSFAKLAQRQKSLLLENKIN